MIEVHGALKHDKYQKEIVKKFTSFETQGSQKAI